MIHLAARAEILIPKEKENLYYNSNILGLQSVLNFASNHKVEKFIFASSASVYGDTKNHKVKKVFYFVHNTIMHIQNISEKND